MPSSSAHKVSCSDHRLFHDALKWTNLYVTAGLIYGTLLLAASLDVLATPWIYLGWQLEETGGNNGHDSIRRRAGALGLATAGVMGLLVAAMVRKSCRLDHNRVSVSVNWHDLFKYTHMGRAIIAAMTAVLTWRGLESLKDFKPAGGGMGRVPSVLLGAAFCSMATAASFHFLHFRLKAVYTEYSKTKKGALKRA